MLPAPLQDASLFMEVDIGTWRALLDVTGETSRFAGKPFTHQELMSSLAAGDIHPGFYSALEAIQELGSDDGRSHIERVATEQTLKLEVCASDTPPREFVAKLLLSSAAEPKLKELLLVAQLTLRSVGSTRTYREFVGKASPGKSALDPEVLKAEIARWCRDHQKHDVINVHAHYFNDEWFCHVVRGDAIKRVMEVRGQAVSTLQYRPAATDLLRYDPKTGRIGIATRYAHMVQGYRVVLGKFLAGDDQYFAGENICSLKPLQKHRKGLFADDRLPQGIFSIRVVELLWRRGDRDKVWVGGRDCFKVLDDLEAKLQEGEIVEARLSFHFAGGERPGHVTLKVPNIIDIKAGRNETLVERFLDTVGIRGSFGDDGKLQSFWSLFPWRLKEADWRRRIGASFDELVARNTLRPIRLAAVTHPEHPAAAGALEVVGIEQGVEVGVSEDQAIGARFLTSSDIEAYELEALALAQDVQRALELQGECRELSSGLWSLGQRTFDPSASIAVFLCLREPADTVAAVVAGEASGRGTAVLLYPECGHNPITHAAAVSCRLPQGPYGHILERIVIQLHWEAIVSPNLWSSADLILDRGRGRAWYRRVELTSLGANTHAFKFAEAVAKEPGKVVTKQDLNSLLSLSRSDDEPAKKAKSAFVKAAEASFKSIGQTCPSEIRKLIVAKAGGYALQGTAKVLE